RAPDTDLDSLEDGVDLQPTAINPYTPQGFHAVPVGDSTTTNELRWEPALFDPTGYRIDRRYDSNPWEQVAALGAGATTWSDTGWIANRHYQYRITALKNAGGQQTESRVAEAEYDVSPNLRMFFKIAETGSSQEVGESIGQIISDAIEAWPDYPQAWQE